MKTTKYYINFGKKKFHVNHWLYMYFNRVKGRKDATSYNNLFNILSGIQKKKKKINERKISELVEATFLIGACRGSVEYITHDQAKEKFLDIKRSVANMTKRIMEIAK